MPAKNSCWKVGIAVPSNVVPPRATVAACAAAAHAERARKTEARIVW
jgi:hypothetical protein